MTLEALIAQNGGFKEFETLVASSLEYWQISGRQSAKSAEIEASPMLIEETKNLLMGLIEYFDDADSRYWSRPYGDAIKIYGTYDHLARYKEWSTSGDKMDG